MLRNLGKITLYEKQTFGDAIAIILLFSGMCG